MCPEDAKVTVNGKRIAGAVDLHHNWRVVIGNNHVFRFAHPEERQRGEKLASALSASADQDIAVNLTAAGDDASFDYAFAMREVNEAAMRALTQGEREARERAEREAREMEARVRSLEANVERERRRLQDEAAQQEAQFRSQQSKQELARHQARCAELEQQLQESDKTNEELIQSNPKLSAIARELKESAAHTESLKAQLTKHKANLGLYKRLLMRLVESAAAPGVPESWVAMAVRSFPFCFLHITHAPCAMCLAILLTVACLTLVPIPPLNFGRAADLAQE